MMGSENASIRSQSDYFRRSRKAALILRQVFHTQSCGGACGNRVCNNTTQLLSHMRQCATGACEYSGCITTKRLLNHFERCQSTEAVVAHPLPTHSPNRSLLEQPAEGSNTDILTEANTRANSHTRFNNGRNFCLICALATSSGGEYTLDAGNMNDTSPNSLFDTSNSSIETTPQHQPITPNSIPTLDLSQHQLPSPFTSQSCPTSPRIVNGRKVAASTFSVHFSDDNNATLCKHATLQTHSPARERGHSFVASPSATALDESSSDRSNDRNKRVRRHSMDSISLLQQREEAECIQLITSNGVSVNGPDASSFEVDAMSVVEANPTAGNEDGSSGVAPMPVVVEQITPAPIIVVRDATALRNYSVSWA